MAHLRARVVMELGAVQHDVDGRDVPIPGLPWQGRKVSENRLDHVRELALGLPDVRERRSHGEPCFFVSGRRALCYFHDNRKGDGRISLWCPAAPGVQDELVATDPSRFFRPQPSAGGIFADWIGVYLDHPRLTAADWREVSEILSDAYRLVAPKHLARQLDVDAC